MIEEDLKMSAAEQSSQALGMGTSFAFAGQGVGSSLGSAGFNIASGGQKAISAMTQVEKRAFEVGQTRAGAIGGLASAAMLGIVGAALASRLYRKSVIAAREACKNAAAVQMCSNKTDFCGTGKDPSPGWLSSFGKFMGAEESSGIPENPHHEDDIVSADGLRHSKMSPCMVINNRGKEDVSGRYFDREIRWRACANPLSLAVDNDFPAGPTLARPEPYSTRVNSCMPQHCVGGTVEQCYVARRDTKDKRECEWPKVCDSNRGISCHDDTDCPGMDCNTPALLQEPTSGHNGCEMSQTTYFGCSRGIQQWILTEKDMSTKYKRPNF